MKGRFLAATGLAATALAAFLVVAAREEPSGWVGLGAPSDLAVLPDGSVAVADPASHVVILFDAEGSRRWTSPPLGAPTGIGLGPKGLWVADESGSRLILIDTVRGTPLDTTDLDGLHPTDVAVASDGALWFTAAPEDLVVRLSPTETSPMRRVESLDGHPLASPRGLVADDNGGVWIAESLAGRILHLDAEGSLLTTVGAPDPAGGQMLKPKNLVFAPDGRLWVAESHAGAVLVYSPGGEFERCATVGGEAAHFAHPLGVAVSGDRLLVAESGAGRVAILQATGPESRSTAPPAPRAGDNTSQLCRQCHDGTVSPDPGVWDTDQKNHPVAEGNCIECHGVHDLADPGQAGSDVVRFGLETRVATPALASTEFCLECHGAYLDASGSGLHRSHPVGVPAPAGSATELAVRGSVLQDGLVTCQTCHRTHGASQAWLLPLKADDPRLCTACHPGQGPESSPHPVQEVRDAPLTGPLAEQVKDLLPPNVLTCLFCHAAHEARSGHLQRGTAAGGGCASCHAPEGQDVAQGGHKEISCSACHGMHGPPQLPVHGAQARGGAGPQACLDCHTTGFEGAQRVTLQGSHVIGPVPNGRIECTTCHTAHGPAADLQVDGADDGRLCVECHKKESTVLRTDHDAAVVAVRGSQSSCVSCHRSHGTDLPYQVPTVRGVNPASGRCLSCHDGRTTRSPGRHDHPKGFLTTVSGLAFQYSGTVPYYGPGGEPTREAEVGEITCATCHDPHRWRHGQDLRPGAAEGSEQDSFLRDQDSIIQFCTVCHGIDGRVLFTSFHSDKFRTSPGGSP